MGKLIQTKGSIKLRGKMFNLQNTRKEPLFENDSVKKLNFGIKTAEDNVHFVQILQFKNNKRVWISTKDGAKEIDWDKRDNYKTGDETVIGVRVKSKNDEQTINLVPTDAIDYVLANFEDGDDVFMLCEPIYREYEGKIIQDKEIKAIFAANEINFEDEEFEEMNDFQQELVFEKTLIDKTRVNVFGRTIDYKGDYLLINFVVDGETNKELAQYLVKKCKFGDILTVVGKIHNRVTYKEVEQEQPQFLIGNLPKSYKNTGKQRVIDSERREFEILGITEHKVGIYKPEDFVKEEIDDDVPDFLK